MQKNCCTCKHGEKHAFEEPCRTCLGKGPEWEKWEPEEPPEMLLMMNRAEHARMHGRMQNGGKWEPEGSARPEMFEKPVPVYESDTSEYPDMLRVSFRDGHTEIYERRIRQPAPIIMKCIETIREWNIGYQYQPKRRRRAKR